MEWHFNEYLSFGFVAFERQVAAESSLITSQLKTKEQERKTNSDIIFLKQTSRKVRSLCFEQEAGFKKKKKKFYLEGEQNAIIT